MRNHLLKAIAVIFVLSVTAQHAAAACSKGTIQGNFAGEAVFQESPNFWGTNSVMMVFFNGTGGLKIKRIVEGVEGQIDIGQGSGTYGLAANCTGKANINLKQGGVVVAQGRLEFVVGGTVANPEIFGVYKNKNNLTTGSVRLIKSNL